MILFTYLRLAARNLRHSPGFTVVAVLALALGIGANTAIFSGVKALLLGPMPYSHPEQLVAVWEDASSIGFPENNPAPANYLDWKKMNHVFSGMAAARYSTSNLTGNGNPEALVGMSATADFLDVLGARPILGRLFTEKEDRDGERVIVISYALWQRRFAGDRNVIGRTVRMNDEPFSVIGVMPPGFSFPARQFEFWRPAHFTPQQWAMRDNHFLHVVARLRAGVSITEARADMSRIAGELQRQYPDSNGKQGSVVVSLRNDLVGDSRSALLILSAAAGLVLLIACANVANLLLVRGSERQREIAVRTALGASQNRIVFQLMIENLLLALAGAGLGLALALAGMQALQLAIPPELVNAATLVLDFPILCFAIAVSLVSVALFGLLPAFESSRLDVNEALKQGGRTMAASGSRARAVFVVAQVALALVLLSGAGLLIQTLANLRSVDLGFPSDHLLTISTPLSNHRYDTDAKTLSFAERVVEKVSAIPGVRSAGFASNLPFTSIGNTRGFVVEGRPPSRDDQFNDALNREISGHYLQTLGVRLLAGRLIDERDTSTSRPAVVINETFARRFWPGASAVGNRFRFGDKDEPWRTVVGVIADVRERGLALDMKPAVYVPATQIHRWDADYLLIRTTVDPPALTRAVRHAVASIDPEQPLELMRTMDEYVALETRGRNQQMNVFAVFAALALFLAALGIYGVLVYTVNLRRREIGVRLALGADTANVAALVLRQGLALIALGLAIGCALSVVASRAMEKLLFGVKPADPVAFSAAAAILSLSALVACALPAFTAARVDPMMALRDE